MISIQKIEDKASLALFLSQGRCYVQDRCSQSTSDKVQQQIIFIFVVIKAEAFPSTTILPCMYHWSCTSSAAHHLRSPFSFFYESSLFLLGSGAAASAAALMKSWSRLKFSRKFSTSLYTTISDLKRAVTK